MRRYHLTKQHVDDSAEAVVVGQYWPLLDEPELAGAFRAQGVAAKALQQQPTDGFKPARFYSLDMIEQDAAGFEKMLDYQGNDKRMQEVAAARKAALHTKHLEDVDDIVLGHLKQRVWLPPYSAEDIIEMEFLITEDASGRYGYTDDKEDAVETDNNTEAMNLGARVAGTAAGNEKPKGWVAATGLWKDLGAAPEVVADGDRRVVRVHHDAPLLISGITRGVGQVHIVVDHLAHV